MKLIIWGINGYMGKWIKQQATLDSSIQLIGGIDAVANSDENVYTTITDLPKNADVIIDFSRSSAIDDILDYALANNTALVLASTGYTDAQLEKIANASKKLAILQSGNLSIGVNVLLSIVEEAAEKLDKTYDIEIVEAHHRRKVDSPSGTANMLRLAIDKGRGEKGKTQYGRHSDKEPREIGEIGIHSVRGGTIVGEHTVIFAGDDETIEIKHTALSRIIFANGAIRAAKAMETALPALYKMSDIL